MILAPRLLLRAAAAIGVARPEDDRIVELTGLTRQEWQEVGAAFPALGPDPGLRAARARLRLRWLVARALGDPGEEPAWRGRLPERPVVLATAHVGDLRALRYLLRRRAPVASVVASEVDRGGVERDDAAFDRRFPRDFPHVFSSRSPHALRGALRRGSLLLAADLPSPAGAQAEILGGAIHLDPRPFRLARIASVACHAAFLTAPRGTLTVTVSPPLPPEEAAALEFFGGELARVAAESPFEIDGITRRGALP